VATKQCRLATAALVLALTVVGGSLSASARPFKQVRLAARAGRTPVVWSQPATNQGGFHQISCATARRCVAIATDGNMHGQRVRSWILTTVDGGAHWVETYRLNGSFDLAGVTCPSASDCVVSGQDPNKDALLLHSSDGGLQWHKAKPAGPALVYEPSVACPTVEQCYALGSERDALKYIDEPDEILSSVDGGATWRSIGVTSGPEASVACVSATTCVAIGLYEKPGKYTVAPATSPVAVGTTDGWDSMHKVTFPKRFGGPGGIGVTCTTARCIAVSVPSRPLLSTTDGRTWGYMNTPPRVAVGGVSCSTNDDCLLWGITSAGVDRSVVMKTSSGGQSWTTIAKFRNYDNVAYVTCAVSGGCFAAISTPTPSSYGLNEIVRLKQ
jgi:hypothetical protein